MVLFNRSWYNRAGVERVLGFCTADEHEEFVETAQEFEHMLVRSGIRLLKYYLDVSREEQARRLEDRKRDPLKQWKLSPIDAIAQEHWAAYSRARDEMLGRTRRGPSSAPTARAGRDSTSSAISSHGSITKAGTARSPCPTRTSCSRTRAALPRRACSRRKCGGRTRETHVQG